MFNVGVFIPYAGHTVPAYGISRDSQLTLYDVEIKHFILGGIDLGKRTIFVSRNASVRNALLGRDILCELSIYQEAGANVLHISKDIVTVSPNGLLSDSQVTSDNLAQALRQFAQEHSAYISTDTVKKCAKLLPDVVDMDYKDFAWLMIKTAVSLT